MTLTWALALTGAIASVPASLRWLRTAQREHYIPGSVSRFAWRWWSGAPNPLILAAALAGVVGTLWDPRPGFVVVAAQFGPVGLPVRGVTSPLAWTRRLKRLAAAHFTLTAAGLVAGAVAGLPVITAAVIVGLPLVADLALAALHPVETRLGEVWVHRASEKLSVIGADVVAITGSYGKTTTKAYVAHLVGPSLRTLASPASFNNAMGLARAVNENLAPGTEAFIAEMGTYGPGEISRLCSFFPPRIAAIVAIGPVHLERFRTLERIVSSKAEILERAEIGVICVDHPLLERLADERSTAMTITRVSAAGGWVSIDGVRVMAVPDGVFGANLAVALGIGRALGVDQDAMVARTGDLPRPEHRLSTTMSAAGVTIIDDTFNSNPAGARAGLEMLAAAEGGRSVVVTPGMVELGSAQDEENERFARDAAQVADHMVIVGRTNRRSLLRGSGPGPATVTVVGTRAEAVAWVRGNLGEGDVVLYENDLPDHYP